MLAACINAGNFLAQYAMYTDRILQGPVTATQHLDEGLDGEEVLEQLLDALTAPSIPVPEEERFALVDVREVRLLPDGRFGAVVETAVGPGAGGQGTHQDWAVYVWKDGRVLIDDVGFGIRGDGISGMATPVATPVP